MADPAQPLRVIRHLEIPTHELDWRFSGSGGPGGQHANTANSRVELRFDVLASTALGPRQRARLLEKFGPVIRVVVSDERSQLRNRELALDRLAARIESALRTPRVRQATRPGTGARERRLKEKHLRSQHKRDRQSPGLDE